MSAPERIWAEPIFYADDTSMIGGDWSVDEMAGYRFEYVRADPAPAPSADVQALVEAVEALGAMPEGYCFCSAGRIGDDSKVHEPECRDIRAALASVKGKTDE